MTKEPTGRHLTFLVWRDSNHPDGGGSELFVERVARHLAAHGWAVTVCCAAYEGAPREESRDGFIIRRRGGRLTVYLHGLAYVLSRRGRRQDIIVDVQNGIPFFAPLVRRRGVVNLVHHVHREQWQIIYPGRMGRFGWWLESRLAPRLYRHCRYITVSEASKHDLHQLGISPHRVAVVHNGIDIPHPEHQGRRAGDPTICVLGRLVPHKQVEHALEVVARIGAANPRLHLDVIGDGWWRSELEAAARRLDVVDRVTFHGNVTDAGRDELLDRAWVMLAPSVKEGWGIAIMEAAARGVPTIAYRTAGGVCESIVDGHTGWLVDDEAALGKRADELINDAELREQMGRAARERAASFTWSTTGSSFTHIVEQVAESPRPADPGDYLSP